MTAAGLDHQNKNKNKTNAVTLKTYMENEKKKNWYKLESICNNFKH